ncbi:cobalamin-binding protein [Leeia oryzae]|uniref:cobalamin-binding protein n=1 Tax=Leeia oryzae TaxID=356662 RepID=UPI00039EEA51|nr:cobalamin-binding protein [Leeia oryzae]
MGYRISGLLVLCASLWQLPALAELRVVDDAGKPVVLAGPAKRIVSLSPHLTEDLFAIGVGDRVVGAVDYSDYPAAAVSIPRVGGYSGLDLEKIRALKPDLIVAWQSGNPQPQLARLAQLGIPVFMDNAQQLSDVPTVLQRLGVLTGQTGQAQLAGQQFAGKIETLRRRYAHKKAVRVFYLVWRRPLMTINKAQIISDAMRVCGARNVFADLPTLVPTVDEEAVIVANPEMILNSAESGAADLQPWKAWPSIMAVKHQQLVTLPKDLLTRMGPRLADGVAALCQAVERARKW